LVPTQSHLKLVAESLPGVKRPGREADLPPQSLPRLRMRTAIPPLALYVVTGCSKSDMDLRK
jgi:hypothetical protein